MRIPTIIIGCLVTLATTARGVEEIRLFDGKTLDGWVAEGASSATVDGKTVPVWSVVDGALHCQGKGFGFLRYDRQEFSDFTFHAEFKMAPKCNSGIGIRTRAFDPTQSARRVLPITVTKSNSSTTLANPSTSKATAHSTAMSRLAKRAQTAWPVEHD